MVVSFDLQGTGRMSAVRYGGEAGNKECAARPTSPRRAIGKEFDDKGAVRSVTPRCAVNGDQRRHNLALTDNNGRSLRPQDSIVTGKRSSNVDERRLQRHACHTGIVGREVESGQPRNVIFAYRSNRIVRRRSVKRMGGISEIGDEDGQPSFHLDGSISRSMSSMAMAPSACSSARSWSRRVGRPRRQTDIVAGLASWDDSSLTVHYSKAAS